MEIKLPLAAKPSAPKGHSASTISGISKHDESANREMEPAQSPVAFPRVEFVYFDAGGGHRSAMNALSAVIREEQPSWDLTRVNLQELFDPLDLARKLIGIRVQDVYNLLLEKGWTLGADRLLRVLHTLIRRHHSEMVALLERHWQKTQPDLVVSLVPNFNRQLAESLHRAIPHAPFVTVLTDLADYPPHFWIEPESEYLICGTKRAVDQALSIGHSEHRVFLTSGMVLNPAFYSAVSADRPAERQALGLDSHRLTGLVLFGGQGSRAMIEVAQRLKRSARLQLVFIAGRNPKIESKLRSVRFQVPVHIVGFTSRVHHYMQLSDFFIGKPGPGSISEALQAGLPVIVQRNAWTLPQERFNTDWIREREVGIVVRNFKEVDQAVDRLLNPPSFARYQANARALQNRAVFEIPAILQLILTRTKGGTEAREPRQ